MNRLWRKKYIVDRKFQWTLIAFTLVVSLLTTTLQLLIDRFTSIRMVPWPYVVAIYGAFYVGLLMLAVLVTNRIAGPLFRLRRHLNEASRGKPLKKIFFRSDDYFSDLNQVFNAYVESLGGKDDDKGFSLPELMITVAIVGLLSAIAYGSFANSASDRFRFRSDVTTLTEALNTARNAAVTKNQCAFVTVTNPQLITIQTYAIPSPCDQLPLPAADFVQTVRFPATTTVSPFNVGQTLIFRPTGGLLTTNPATLSVTAQGGTSQFTIYPAIGQVRHQ